MWVLVASSFRKRVLNEDFVEGFVESFYGCFLWKVFVKGFVLRRFAIVRRHLEGVLLKCKMRTCVGDSGLCYINLYWVGGWYFETGSLGTL